MQKVYLVCVGYACEACKKGVTLWLLGAYLRLFFAKSMRRFASSLFLVLGECVLFFLPSRFAMTSLYTIPRDDVRAK